MVRICDGRMSGTAYGTVVLHVAPEAAAGGPLGLVRTGDSIMLDVAAPAPRRRRSRTRSWPRGQPSAGHASPASPRPRRGWERLYVDHVLQADTGADLDFLVGSSGDRRSPASRTDRRRAR